MTCPRHGIYAGERAGMLAACSGTVKTHVSNPAGQAGAVYFPVVLDDHADRPADRLRRAGGGRHPAAAGDHRRIATIGLLAPLSQIAAVDPVDQRGRPANRSCPRRGLRVFAVFGTLSFVAFKHMGLGLVFAVLLDATLIRGILLPASMKLLGERNWWLPKRLHWLPKVHQEPEVAPARV
jgi:hypothetical protein